MQKINKKDESISFIRFIAMLMIVLCHMMQSMNNELALPVNIIIIVSVIIVSAFILKYLANIVFNLLNKKEIKVISD